METLNEIVMNVNKQFGNDTLRLLGDSDVPSVDVVSTGSLALDLALGVGGIPKGRIAEIYGPDASGKTTICQHVIAQGQAAGLVCAYIDMEHALDLAYAAKCGVNVRDLLFSQPDYGEQALAIAEYLIKSGNVQVIVVDSVAALVPRAELEGDVGDAHVGIQARMMSQYLRRIAAEVKRSNAVLMFVNQLRQKIGVTWGNPETTSGGVALKYYASVRLDIRRIQTLKGKEDPLGIKVRVRVIKNKVAPPLRQAEFDIRYGHGIDTLGELIDLGVRFDVVAKRGSYFYYDDLKLGQGRENAIETLAENNETRNKIRDEIQQIVSEDSLVLSVTED